MADPIIALEKVRREFATGDTSVVALDDISLSIQPGEMVAIIGSSGSGKSTLLNILGCLDRPTSGTYRVAGKNVSELDADQLAALRREHFGFIFQRYHLLGDLSAAANVEIPAVYAGINARERRTRATELLERLGVATRSGHRPNQLSGGQQQRVSIARALINGAEVILADEPTGALDRRSGEEVLKILKELHREDARSSSSLMMPMSPHGPSASSNCGTARSPPIAALNPQPRQNRPPGFPDPQGIAVSAGSVRWGACMRHRAWRWPRWPRTGCVRS